MKTALGDKRRNRQARRERLVFAAERAVELAQEIVAEAGGERRARQIDDVADLLEADALERGDRLVRQPQRLKRQWRKERARVIADCHIGKARRGVGSADGRGNRGTRGKTPSPHPREQVGAQLLLAAEQMRAAADIEQNSIGRIGGDERRVALAPVGKGVDEARVGRLILGDGGERGMHGARLRQCEAGMQSEALRRCVHRNDEIEIAALAEHDER